VRAFPGRKTSALALIQRSIDEVVPYFEKKDEKIFS
jgi:hypothetical protein